MEAPFNVMVIGKVSTGKSSFINSLVGAFVSCVSLNRETFNPIKYTLSPTGNYKYSLDITMNLINIRNENQKDRKLLAEMKESEKSNTDQKNKLEERISNLNHKHKYDNKLSSVFKFDVDLYDMPGISDSEDKLNLFEKTVETWINQMDLVLYLVDASTAFLDKHELVEYKKVVAMVNKNIEEHGHYTELIVVVNKYDDKDDDELAELYEQIPKKINDQQIFRFSSHKFFVNNLKNGLFIPKFMVREAKKIFKNGQLIDKNFYDKLDNDANYTCINKNALDGNKNEFIFIEPSMFSQNLETKNGDHDDLINYIHELKNNFMNKKIDTLLNKLTKILETISVKRENIIGVKYSKYEPNEYYKQTINALDKALNIKEQICKLGSVNPAISIIMNHITKSFNYLTISYLWFHMRRTVPVKIKKIFSDRIFNIILEDLKNSTSETSKRAIYFPDIFMLFGKNAHLLLSYTSFWNMEYIIDHKNNDKYALLGKPTKINFEEVFPELKYYIYLAELPYQKLHDLYYMDYLKDIGDSYKLRIKKFLTTNSSGQMLHNLFGPDTNSDIEELVKQHMLMKASCK